VWREDAYASCAKQEHGREHRRGIEPTIRASVLAPVVVLGVPAGVYSGPRGSLGAGTANGLALDSSVVVALAIVGLFPWRRG
jgi:hypothetical protein